ncbi:MAG: 30S ribosome-binding factor RbfA [Armatimonadota bacterium]|nr:30S ribosome-binding factor RbfA [Armatimonadota bacterium]MDR7532360.1 30S ribosome-binding factor RbfA [Armatimonadota bacterium]MDR7535287.1 30S ribosome-binding factor RbfA [Armatimonadota bacterium]
MPHPRAARLAEVIRTEVSAIIRTLRDPRIGFVSVTDVEVSQDLRHARIFVSVLGDAAAKQRTMEGLEHATGYVRSLLGPRLGIRLVPEIVFRLDPSIERGVRITSLLRELAEEPSRDPQGGDRSGSRP